MALLSHNLSKKSLQIALRHGARQLRFDAEHFRGSGDNSAHQIDSFALAVYTLVRYTVYRSNGPQFCPGKIVRVLW